MTKRNKNLKISPAEARRDRIIEECSQLGAKAFDEGVKLCENPFGATSLMERSAWCAGWFDRSRGMVGGAR